MNRCVFIAATLLACIQINGAVRFRTVVVAAEEEPGGYTPAWAETFEGDNDHTWTVSGSVTTDHTPALVGSESARADATGGTAEAYAQLDTARSTVSFFAEIRVDTLPSAASDLMRLRLNTSTSCLILQVGTDGKLRLRHGTGTYSSYTSDSISSLTPGSSFYVWATYVASGAGQSNGSATLEWSASRDGKTGSGTKYTSLSGAPGENTVSYIYIRAGSSSVSVFDDIMVDSDPIPSDP